MERKALVAYASKYGSTQEVAEAIAGTLRESGIAVDVQHVRKVRSVTGYDVVVLGAPFYLGAWHRDAADFLARHREALTARAAAECRVAVFALGPTQGDAEEWQSARAALDTELAKYPWLAPVATELFGGRYDPRKLRLPDNLLTALPASPLHGLPASDIRDWTAIRAWAGRLAAQLQSA